MKLKFIIPQKTDTIYRASVHRTGRIGFTIKTASHFGIKVGKSIGLAINEDDEKDSCIYAILYDKVQEDAYKVNKAGNYHSINAKSFFDTIRVDYSEGNLSYNINEVEIDGTKVLKCNLKMSEKRRERGSNK